MAKSILFFFCFMIGISGWAKLEIPTSMTSENRRIALEVLGYGSAPSLLTDPYPLGGYSGYEFGVSNIIVPTTELSRIGNKPELQGETSYLQLSFAKGLFHNFDLFLNFAPLGQSEQISSFGGGFKWAFFEAEYMPLSVSTVLSANSTSFQNKINVSSQTLDLVMGLNVDDMALYLGAGQVRASGVFIGGATGVNLSTETESESLSDTRVLGGLILKFSRVFVGLEVARVTQPSYALKIGGRF
jgi:hypothetical protein